MWHSLRSRMRITQCRADTSIRRIPGIAFKVKALVSWASANSRIFTMIYRHRCQTFRIPLFAMVYVPRRFGKLRQGLVRIFIHLTLFYPMTMVMRLSKSIQSSSHQNMSNLISTIPGFISQNHRLIRWVWRAVQRTTCRHGPLWSLILQRILCQQFRSKTAWETVWEPAKEDAVRPE